MLVKKSTACCSPWNCDNSAVFWLRDMATRVQDKLSTTHTWISTQELRFNINAILRKKERSMNRGFNATHDSEIVEIVMRWYVICGVGSLFHQWKLNAADSTRSLRVLAVSPPHLFPFTHYSFVHVFSRAKNRRSWHVTLWRPCGIFSRADKSRLC